MNDLSRLSDSEVTDMLRRRSARPAPGGLASAVLESLASERARHPVRTAGRSAKRPLVLLAAAALLLVGGAMAAGSGLVRLPSVVPPVPAPTLPVAVASPTAGPESLAPSEAPSTVPYRAASWTATGNMVAVLAGRTPTLLRGGDVLVAGGASLGVGSCSGTSAELYDPASGSWTPTGSMGTRRAGHTATLLPDGRVLVAGGSGGPADNADCGDVASAELYDPRTGTWIPTGSMGTPRSAHTATLLPDGRVLVVGGTNDLGTIAKGYAASLTTAELYDPASGTWTPTGSMGTPRSAHTATLLPDGRVLVAGGLLAPTGSVASAELYDPASGTWTPTGSMDTKRQGSTATLLPDGRVLVAGGSSVSGVGIGIVVLGTAELYDPRTGAWTATGSMGAERERPTATLLPDGRVLVAGGDDFASATFASAELYDPGTGSWVATASMGTPRTGHTAMLLPDGRVLVVGWQGAEIYDPGTGQ